jgi:ribosomal protein S18 acetylase RimI-like enzyme
LQAALRHPEYHIQLAADDGDTLAGFVLARVVRGEFGWPDAAAILEAIGVEPAAQHRRIGRRLLDGLEAVMRRKGIREVRTQAEWTNDPLLGFLRGTGFSLAPGLILERGWLVSGQPEARPGRRSGAAFPPEPDEEPAGRDDPGAPASPDVAVRSLQDDDLAELVRIDREITGEDRTDYLGHKLDEVLNESAIRVSLIAETEPRPVGFIMARVDFGEYGQMEPVAVIDTIAVDPRLVRQGIGNALLSQLLANMGALRVERVETQVAWDNFELLGFFHHCGFGPSQSLAFGKQV